MLFKIIRNVKCLSLFFNLLMEFVTKKFWMIESRKYICRKIKLRGSVSRWFPSLVIKRFESDFRFRSLYLRSETATENYQRKLFLYFEVAASTRGVNIVYEPAIVAYVDNLFVNNNWAILWTQCDSKDNNLLTVIDKLPCAIYIIYWEFVLVAFRYWLLCRNDVRCDNVEAFLRKYVLQFMRLFFTIIHID